MLGQELAAARVGRHPAVGAGELDDPYWQMTSDRRSGELLPEHLVSQQAPDGEHLATYDPARTNGGGR